MTIQWWSDTRGKWAGIQKLEKFIFICEIYLDLQLLYLPRLIVFWYYLTQKQQKRCFCYHFFCHTLILFTYFRPLRFKVLSCNHYPNRSLLKIIPTNLFYVILLHQWTLYKKMTQVKLVLGTNIWLDRLAWTNNCAIFFTCKYKTSGSDFENLTNWRMFDTQLSVLTKISLKFFIIRQHHKWLKGDHFTYRLSKQVSSPDKSYPQVNPPWH